MQINPRLADSIGCPKWVLSVCPTSRGVKKEDVGVLVQVPGSDDRLGPAAQGQVGRTEREEQGR